MSRWYVTITPKTSSLRPVKRSGSTRAVFGFQRVEASPISASINPRVMTSVTSVGAP